MTEMFREYVFADVSIKIRPFSSANLLASSWDTSRWNSRSLLFPINMITVLGLVIVLASFSQVVTWVNVSRLWMQDDEKKLVG